MPRDTPEEVLDKDARGAMQGLIAGRGLPTSETDPLYPDQVASIAFDVAEAMAEERERRSKGLASKAKP